MIFRTIRFEGDRGKHEAGNGSDCPGRAFDVRATGAGGVSAKFVRCTDCNIEFVAWENGLGPKAAL